MSQFVLRDLNSLHSFAEALNENSYVSFNSTKNTFYLESKENSWYFVRLFSCCKYDYNLVSIAQALREKIIYLQKHVPETASDDEKARLVNDSITIAKKTHAICQSAFSKNPTTWCCCSRYELKQEVSAGKSFLIRNLEQHAEKYHESFALSSCKFGLFSLALDKITPQFDISPLQTYHPQLLKEACKQVAFEKILLFFALGNSLPNPCAEKDEIFAEALKQENMTFAMQQSVDLYDSFLAHLIEREASVQGSFYLFAANHNLPKTISALKAKQLNCVVKDGDGNTPLHKAFVKGHLEALRALMLCSPSFSEVNKQRETPVLAFLKSPLWNETNKFDSMKAIFLAFFPWSRQVEFMWKGCKSGTDLLKALTANAQSLVKLDSSLEIPFLIHDPKLTEEVLHNCTEKQFLTSIQLLETKFPTSSLTSFFLKGFVPTCCGEDIPLKSPTNVALDLFLNHFDALNLEDQNLVVFNQAIQRRGQSKAILRRELVTAIGKIKNRTYFFGCSNERTTAFSKEIETLHTLLLLCLQELEKCKNSSSSKSFQFFANFFQFSTKPYGLYYQELLKQYISLTKTPSQSILKTVSELRETLLHKIASVSLSQYQINNLCALVGKDLGLPHAGFRATCKDSFGDVIPKETIEKIITGGFPSVYTAEAVYEEVAPIFDRSPTWHEELSNTLWSKQTQQTLTRAKFEEAFVFTSISGRKAARPMAIVAYLQIIGIFKTRFSS